MARAENNKIDSELNKSIAMALDCLKCGDFDDANSLFLNIMHVNYDSEVAEFGIASCKFWKSRYDKICNVTEGIEQGSFILQQWQKYEDFYNVHKRRNERVYDALQYCIYSKALNQFNKEMENKKSNNANLLYLSGLANKKIGDFENALLCFDRFFLSTNKKNCNALAQLADTYMLLDKVNESKVLFREAFSLNPDAIDLEQIDCSMMQSLIERVSKAESSCEESILKHWIAVYGWLDGVLNIYREMTMGEVTRIGSEIKVLEHDLSVSKSYNALIVAKLMNRYFWLYDFYSLQEVSNKQLLNLEEKMKKISYNLYTIFKQSNQETK